MGTRRGPPRPLRRFPPARCARRDRRNDRDRLRLDVGLRQDLLHIRRLAGLVRPEAAREVARTRMQLEQPTTARPDWIIQATNDAWFGTLTGPYQHFAQTRLRAIEQGLPLIRAANTGISAVIDARGHIATDLAGAPAILPLGVQGVIDAPLPGAFAAPPYARMLAFAGDWPIAAFLLLALLIWRVFGVKSLPRSTRA